MSHHCIEFRDRPVGGPVTNGTRTSGCICDLRTARHIVFLLHGYNVCRKRGEELLGNLASLLNTSAIDQTVSVLWPGDHWSGAVSYPFEGRDADDTAVRLARYIDEVIDPIDGAGLSFVSHSLGARVVMGAVRRLQSRGRKIRQVCLMAAAIDDTSLANPRAYRTAAERVDRIAVLSSRKDRILRWGYPAGDLVQAFLFWRDDAGRPLGLNGPRDHRKHTLPATVTHLGIPESRDADHGHYLPVLPPDNTRESKNQISAANYASDVLAGKADPVYP